MAEFDLYVNDHGAPSGDGKKKLVINAAVCDARDVTGETLQAYSGVTINAATILTTASSRELLHRCDAELNACSVTDVPEGGDVAVSLKNGNFTIGPGDREGKPTVLIVNGALNVEKGAEAALTRFVSITVNGKLTCPQSLAAALAGAAVNGSTEIYPDDAVPLKSTLVLDRVFALRARAVRYYVSGRVIALDESVSLSALAEKGVRFLTPRAVVAEPQLEAALPLFPEEAEIAVVPAGCAYVPDDAVLSPALLHRYGPKLFVRGDLTVPADAGESLRALEFLRVDGDVLLPEALAENFAALDAVCGTLQTYRGRLLSDRPEVRVDAALLERSPEGVSVIDCAEAVLAPDISAELIVGRLRLRDCANVICTPEQRSAVEQVCEDVANIDDEEDSRTVSGGLDGAGGLRMVFDKLKTTKVVNAVSYKL